MKLLSNSRLKLIASVISIILSWNGYSTCTAQNGSIRYDTFIVKYKFIKEKDSIYCPSECTLKSFYNGETFYFIPNRTYNSELIKGLGPKYVSLGNIALYKTLNSYFLDLPSSEDLYVTEYNEQGLSIKHLVIESNAIYEDSDSSLYIIFLFTGFVNIYHSTYYRENLDNLIRVNQIKDEMLAYPLYKCILFNSFIEDTFAVYNLAIQYSPVDRLMIINEGLRPSEHNRIILSPISY